MEEIKYVGEHLWLGTIGHILTLLAFVMAILSSISYILATNNKDPHNSLSWLKLGRIGFIGHSASIISVIGLIFFMMLQRYYEYQYAFAHVSDDLPFQYIFSAFWEGQEGSFLLWMFWHVVLGLILIRTAKTWESSTMSLISLVQVILVTMVLGMYFGAGDTKIGSSPFILSRELTELFVFQRADYLTMWKGNGLNPLLQNYWMTIHPPTLFFGFASTIVPFAFAFAGFWTRRYTEWLRPALSWALFSAIILGTGLMMGAAWAYEALSFGGYWAWDPVENSSFVPWLALVAGIHTSVVAKNTGHGVGASYLFFTLSFLLVLYSTFLTRSGILGDSSAHAFTEMGLEWQLLILMAAFKLPALILFLMRYKKIPSPTKEESAYSREFWLFIGALVLFFSAVLIIFTTSIPVFNKLLHSVEHLFNIKILEADISEPKDRIAHYNSYQIWIGVLIGILSGAIQFLRYRGEKTSYSKWYFPRHHGIAGLLALVVMLPTSYLMGVRTWQYNLLIWSAFFTIFSNIDYLFNVLKGKINIAGSAVAHIGLGIMFIGFVYTGALKDVISTGFAAIEALGENFNPQTTQSVLLIKNSPTPLKEYKNHKGEVTARFEAIYKSDTIIGNAQYLDISFHKKDKNNQILESFHTQPNVLFKMEADRRRFAAANPSTKHYLHKDIFTTAVPHWAFDDEKSLQKKAAKEDSIAWVSHEIQKGDSIQIGKYTLVFDDYNKTPNTKEYKPNEDDIALALQMSVFQKDSLVAKAQPVYFIRSNAENSPIIRLKEQGILMRFTKILIDKNKAILETKPIDTDQDYVVLQGIIFPWINLVWFGFFVTMFGTLLSLRQRLKN